MPSQTINLGHVVGEDGKNPYQYAVEAGYTGTEQEYKEAVASGPWLPLSGGAMESGAIISTKNDGPLYIGDVETTGIAIQPKVGAVGSTGAISLSALDSYDGTLTSSLFSMLGGQTTLAASKGNDGQEDPVAKAGLSIGIGEDNQGKIELTGKVFYTESPNLADVNEVVNKGYVDEHFVNKSGDSMTGNLSMENHRITNLTSPTSTTDATNKSYVDKKSIQYGTCSTSSSLSAKTVSSAGFTLSTGAIICVKFTYANTGSITLNVNATGAKTVRTKGRALIANEIQASQIALFRYDGTYWQLLNPCGLALNGGTVSGDINMGGNKITNIGTPESENDVTNKTYVDSVANPYTKLVTNFFGINSDEVTIDLETENLVDYDEIVISVEASFAMNYTGAGNASASAYIFNPGIPILKVTNNTSSGTRSGSYLGHGYGLYRLYRMQNVVSPDYLSSDPNESNCYYYQTNPGDPSSENVGSIIGSANQLRIKFGKEASLGTFSVEPSITISVWGRRWHTVIPA